MILTSILWCLSLLSRAPVAAFIHSMPNGSRSLVPPPRLAGGVAGRANFRLSEAMYPLLLRSRARASVLSKIVMASGWDEEGPVEDPFDESKMSAQGKHVINWCVYAFVDVVGATVWNFIQRNRAEES